MGTRRSHQLATGFIVVEADHYSTTFLSESVVPYIFVRYTLSREIDWKAKITVKVIVETLSVWNKGFTLCHCPIKSSTEAFSEPIPAPISEMCNPFEVTWQGRLFA